MSVKTLYCVVGPTAIGKTKFAIALAQTLETEILSSDSRQFYKELHIGTAVPSKEELQAIPHHCIQHQSIFNTYTVGDFEKDALLILNKQFKTKQAMVLVGGSGLYTDAVVNGLDIFPVVPETLKNKIINLYSIHGLAWLQKEVATHDPDYYNAVDVDNAHRLIRALTVSLVAKKPYSSFLNQPKKPRPFKTIYIGLEADRSEIYNRINARVETMFKAGLLNEAKALYPNKTLNALQTVGYKELFLHFDGQLTLNQAKEAIKQNTRRFAKRQLTWYRKNPDVNWFPNTTAVKDVLKALNGVY